MWGRVDGAVYNHDERESPSKKNPISQFKEVLIVKEMRKALDIYLKF